MTCYAIIQYTISHYTTTNSIQKHITQYISTHWVNIHKNSIQHTIIQQHTVYNEILRNLSVHIESIYTKTVYSTPLYNNTQYTMRYYAIYQYTINHYRQPNSTLSISMQQTILQLTADRAICAEDAALGPWGPASPSGGRLRRVRAAARLCAHVPNILRNVQMLRCFICCVLAFSVSAFGRFGV